MQERLQKIIAAAGICSRRDAEQLILDRAVTVNGQVVTTLGTKADPEVDIIELRGHGRLNSEQQVYILINKPQNVVTTVDDPLGRRTVLELLDMVAGKGKGPADLPRLYPVGRLDFDAEGALILTNDGELAHMLMHPRHNVPKVYEVKIKGQATEEELDRLRRGVRLPDMNGGLEPATAPAEVEVIKLGSSNSWLRITIHEGRHHQVKRMCQAIGHFVIHLIRVAYANLTIDDLEPGHWRHLAPAEVEKLKEIAKNGLAKGGKRAPKRHFTAAPGQEARSFSAAHKNGPSSQSEHKPRRKDEPRSARQSSHSAGETPRGMGKRQEERSGRRSQYASRQSRDNNNRRSDNNSRRSAGSARRSGPNQRPNQHSTGRRGGR